jgi:hypothetical protein
MRQRAPVDMEVELEGHAVRLQVEFDLGSPATPPSFNRWTGGMVDPGDPGEAATANILAGWVQRKRSSGYVMEKPLPKAVLKMLREDSRLEEWLLEKALEAMPNE